MSEVLFNRRTLLKTALPTLAGIVGFHKSAHGKEADSPPVRVITKGPRYHWGVRSASSDYGTEGELSLE